ncbi:hypothetical protein E5C26_11520 [Serratia proteamaculans]|uniref:hypothetical protein n=1 Tax=Serratia proteamaculans TaxID=28151 RepID=UPI0010760034|nr:hypothetical protein [Serratia proteamaculans]TFZ50989.1 hypothetical protein E5C26_11520 [Serratia proteamaculans]
MKELTPQQIACVSGGASASEQANKLFKDLFGWLSSDANPLNGLALGKSIGHAIGGFVMSFAQLISNAFKAK